MLSKLLNNLLDKVFPGRHLPPIKVTRLDVTMALDTEHLQNLAELNARHITRLTVQLHTDENIRDEAWRQQDKVMYTIHRNSCTSLKKKLKRSHEIQLELKNAIRS